MSAKGPLSNPSPPAPRWRLWVDGCGGFLLLGGDRWTVGGVSEKSEADICVRADWPRRAGAIIRQESDYFWRPTKNEPAKLITDGQSVPIQGTATMILSQPSPLCSSATLLLKAPHRFGDHVDAVVLVSDTLLIGSASDCHIRTPQDIERIVMTRRDGRWMTRSGLTGDFVELSPQSRQTLSSLTMTLEQA